MIIYVIEGSTGEYSDHRDWVVCAYRSEVEAQKRVLELETTYKVLIGLGDADLDEWQKRKRIEEIMKSHDPSFQLDYTGMQYTYYPVELIGE